MPHITTMRRARIGVGDMVLDSLFRKRGSVTEGATNVKDTFSSWDKCMTQTYCKWPAITGILIGGLIVFSILWCCIRCCCCGMSCCCSCFSFLKCFGCCGGACDGQKEKQSRHLNDAYSNHGGTTAGYHAPPPMMAGGFAKPEPLQYAQFEVGKSGFAVAPKVVNEDALPPMPSWETASKKHVLNEDEKDAVELGELDPAARQKVPLMAEAAAPGNSMPGTPTHEMGVATPYGPRNGQGDPNGHIGGANVIPYTQSNGSFASNRVYRDSTGTDRGYGNNSQIPYGSNNFNGPAGSAFDRPMQKQNTGDGNRQIPGGLSRQYTGNTSVDQYSEYSLQSNGFSQPPRVRSRGPPVDNFNAQPPRGPSRGPTPNNNFNQPPRGPSRGANRTPANDSNFKFDSGAQGYPRSRPTHPPQQPSYNSGRHRSPPIGSNDGHYEASAPTYRSQSPPRDQNPGYVAYQPREPISVHQRAPTVLRPGIGMNRRDRREPQGWDPVNN